MNCTGLDDGFSESEIGIKLMRNRVSRAGHELFSEKDGQHMSGYALTVHSELTMCKLCGAIGMELVIACVPRTPVVTFRGADGVTHQARLVRENKLTAVVKPHLWLKSKPCKIHKRKNHMKYTGRMI